MRVPPFELALPLANGTDYALTGGLYSRSPRHIELARRAFDVGNLYIKPTDHRSMVGRQPFGGHAYRGWVRRPRESTRNNS